VIGWTGRHSEKNLMVASMISKDTPPTESQSSADVVSLQSLVVAHLHQLVQCQAAVLSSHAGLLCLDEAELDQYRVLTPPLPSLGEPLTFLQSACLARHWWANALRDVLLLHTVSFEQMRQLLTLARIIEGEGSEEEKTIKARVMIADKPVDASAILARLSDLMDGSWPRQQEFHAFEKLHAMFTTLASGHGQSLSTEPIRVQLFHPEFRGQPVGGDVSFAVREVTRTFSQPAELEPDRELFYETFSLHS
jgi:hypothetical protein